MVCPICGEHRFWFIAFARNADVERWRAEAGDHADYDWRLCHRCGNAYPAHQPEIGVLQRIWAVNRADECRTANARKELWAYRRAISRVGAARSFRLFAPLAAKHGGHFLDIACGLGDTVRIFADNGWEAEGIDADPTTANFHRELGIRARIGAFEQAELQGSYDIIHIAHAVYFVTNPMDFLRGVRARLAPGGLFCIVLADFMATADANLPSYVHTFFPTGASMRYALALAGFDVVLNKRQSGSIYIAARPAPAPSTPRISPAAILLLYRTKALRHAALGRPYLALRRIAKRLLGRR